MTRAAACHHPIERLIHDDALGHAARRLAIISLEALRRAADAIAEDRFPPVDATSYRASVRIDQQLGRIEAIAVPRLLKTVHPIPIPLPRLDTGHESTPDMFDTLGQVQALDLRAAGLVEQAQLEAPGSMVYVMFIS